MMEEFRTLIPQAQWPSDGNLPRELFYWYEPAIEAQENYISYVINRRNSINGRIYREDPSIFAWEISNEARCEVAVCQEAEDKNNSLPQWARRMSEAIRKSGARQLIAWGGAGYQGSHGENMRLIAQTAPEMDVLTLHKYPSAQGAPPFTPSDALEQAEDFGANAAHELRALSQLAHDLGARGGLFEELGYRGVGTAAQTDAQRARVFALAGDAAE
ncbi:MAG: cellulase family glycosylhydrolase [Myxococcales bacterium]|nr:cellulase family glycosylhydrolase [Myxococcales bacterium]